MVYIRFSNLHLITVSTLWPISTEWFLPSSSLWKLPLCPQCLWVQSFEIPHIGEIMQYVFLYLVFILSKVSSRFIHVTNGRISLFVFKTKSYFYVYVHVCVCMSHTFFIHSSVDGHWGHFHILSSVNNVAMNIGMKIPFWEGISLRYWFHFVCLRAQKCHYWITQQGGLFLDFWGNFVLFSILAGPIHNH